jgi:hypothetical protein
MLVVALAGLVMGSVVDGCKMWRLSGDYAARAQKHKNIAIRMSIGAEPERFKIQADHHEYMARKYERAAQYPWLSVDADPPEPWAILEVLNNKDIPC